MYSDNPHFWSDPQVLQRPRHTWEAVKIGNCGSPIETGEGLAGDHARRRRDAQILHRPLLLDLDDPSKVIGHLEEPLLRPESNTREGYVRMWSIPAAPSSTPAAHPAHGMSDTAYTIVTVELGRTARRAQARNGYLVFSHDSDAASGSARRDGFASVVPRRRHGPGMDADRSFFQPPAEFADQLAAFAHHSFSRRHRSQQRRRLAAAPQEILDE